MQRARTKAGLTTSRGGVFLLALLSVLVQPLAAGAGCLTVTTSCHKCCPSAPSSTAPKLSAAANCCVLSVPRDPDWSPQPRSSGADGRSNAEAVKVVVSLVPTALASIATEFNCQYKVISPPIPPLQQACLLLI